MCFFHMKISSLYRVGGWEGNANFKIDFPKGGAIEFAERFQKAVKECK